MKITQFSGAVAGAGVSPEKTGEYSVKFNGIFLTAVTASVKFNGIFRQFNGIFLTASVDTVSVHGTWPRVGARAWSKNYFKNMGVILRLCRARWYIHLSNLSNV